ncbi:glycosyltransferase family 2 protein [uncultured Jatrophihabitans sp.]|uniref:glycosyltransferase family 2 protein n=1 Tax=uncultured Jatrophihabitans sp. TaxID=1610747 RepID=UPI0035CAE984
MTVRVLHLVPGPAEHGVVRHAVDVAHSCGHEVLRVEGTGHIELPTLSAYDVVHVPVTEQLFGRDLDTAAAAFTHLADAVHAAGAALSVTLHDLPHDKSPFQTRRALFYEQVVGAARGVVVNSDVELDLVTPWAVAVHSLRRIRLPVEQVRAVPTPGPAPRAEITVLGFVFPDRGYEDVITALPDDASLVALGRASEGHDDLLERYATLADGRFRAVGFVPDDELAAQLRVAAVPVAPNRRVTASASINTWLAHGRRPLVPDGPYAREVAATRPGALWIYDPDDPADLPDALRVALSEPERTWLGPDVPRGPSPADVAAEYAEHLQACQPPRARALSSGGYVVPGNRWDLLPPASTQPSVSVVVPYFEAQRQLDLVLAALAAQTYPSERVEVMVVDDGSQHPPDVSAAGGLTVQVLRQADEGFRAARARTLGATAASGELLAFLDADTVPEPDYLRALLALPTVCPDAVTVGRRRHADLSTVPITELTEPQWLIDAYRASGNLLRVDRRSYRFLISAVLALPARLFAEVGGFDERFVGYGGEDWELAHRLYAAGAVFAHVPSAVAWHDGPDWAERGEAAAAKNLETLTLAGLLPDPDARGTGSWWPYPSIVVRGPAMSDVDALATARSAFGAGADCMLHLAGVSGPRAELVLADPRVQIGPPADDVLARASCMVDLDGPTDLGELTAMAADVDRLGEVRTPAMRVRSARAVRRAARWSTGDAAALAYALFGRHDRTGPRPWTHVDLAAALRQE